MHTTVDTVHAISYHHRRCCSCPLLYTTAAAVTAIVAVTVTVTVLSVSPPLLKVQMPQHSSRGAEQWLSALVMSKTVLCKAVLLKWLQLLLLLVLCR
jgi:hypothetical protein